MKKIFILIPAYNEEKIIGKVINDVKKEGFKNIIVVDDGSSDKTKEEAKKAGAIVISHLLNRGKGAAIKTGIEFLKQIDFDYLITIDGDGQHNVKDIKKVVAKLDDDYQVVLGNRFLKKNQMPFFNRISNYLANILTYLIYGLYVGDSQSGFRGYSKKAIHLLDLSSDKYEFDSEVIKEIAHHKLKFFEIPIDVFYTPYSLSKKNKQNLINGIRTIINILRK